MTTPDEPVKDEQVTEESLDLLCDADPDVARAVLQSLDLGLDEGGRDLLARLLDDDDRAVRSRVAGLRMWLPATSGRDEW